MVLATPSQDHQDLQEEDRQIKAGGLTPITTDQVQVQATGDPLVPDQALHLEVMVLPEEGLQVIMVHLDEAMDH